MSQAELARAIGITPTSLSLIERGRVQDPRQSIILRIADTLRTSADYLIGRTEEMPTDELKAAVMALLVDAAGHDGRMPVLEGTGHESVP
jgi:transcriptional regulator with XRE-family HTH domain